jgi:PKD repeat protein
MKKIRKICLVSMVALCLLLSYSGFGQAISSRLFGQNAWMPDTIGTTFYNGKLHNHWGTIQASGSQTVRFGGIGADHHMPTNYQYIRMVDSIRAKGMEPILQVPFNNWQFTASQAAAIVQYVNITKGKNVKYWIIGNEPNLGYGYSTAAQIAAYIRPFASAMKAVDPSILIIGPELAWFDQGIINGLTTPGGNDDITGKDANNRYYIDVFSYHTYPFNGSQSRNDVISKLTSTGSMKDNLQYLNGRINTCNNYYTRTGSAAIRTAITEMNINWQNPSTDNVSGLGASSFIGGQFVAEMFSLAMKYSVEIINIWSVIEGSSETLNIGYLDRSTQGKKPLYYHFQMLAQNMNGTYANGTSTVTNVKTFGSKNGSEIKVMIMNQDLAANYNYTVRLNTGSVSGSNPLKMTIDAGVAVEYSDNIPNQTSILLTFNSAGTLTRKCVYSLAGNALAGTPPTCTDVTPTPTAQAPVANFSGNPTQICKGGSVAFTDLSTNTPTSWNWTFAGGTPATSTAQNPVITYNNAGTYAVTLTASNGAGSNTMTMSGYIKVKGKPNAPALVIGPTTELCPSGNPTAVYSIDSVADATSYTWTSPLNTSLVSGQGTRNATLSFTNSFTSGPVTVTADNTCGSSEPTVLQLSGCIASTDTTDTTAATAVIENAAEGHFELNVFPNPNDGKFSVTINADKYEKKDFEITVLNDIGQQVYTAKSSFSNGREEVVLRDDMVSGTYIVRLRQGNKVETKRLMIVH